ncbi:MAG: ATP-binding cassette domain-containing protein, partial [Phycisphaerae bacterium]|nr:ATP-binding cassette domain-containing protein [Phycisphaerae bacterium]
HVLGLMTPPDEGEILFNSQAVPNTDSARTSLRRRHIGFVFQRFNLFGTLSAADNVAISLHVRGLSVDGRVDSLFEAMGITHVARRKPGEMSIGEQQRVATIRALAHRPALLFADEPTGNLDSDNSIALLELLRDMNRREGQTIIMITHSPEAAAFADRVAGMKDGKIIDSHNHS